MTAPLHSDQVKAGRKLVGEYVGSPIQNVGKIRDNSMDYQTIQPGGVHQINMGPGGQYKNSERLAAHQRRAQTRGMN